MHAQILPRVNIDQRLTATRQITPCTASAKHHDKRLLSANAHAHSSTKSVCSADQALQPGSLTRQQPDIVSICQIRHPYSTMQGWPNVRTVVDQVTVQTI